MSISKEDFEDDWRIRLGALTKTYNKLRHECFNKMALYYRQSPYSDYVKESDIIEMLDRLENIRAQMKKISKDNYPDTSGSLYRPRYENRIIDYLEGDLE